jgi:hypothetical protein
MPRTERYETVVREALAHADVDVALEMSLRANAASGGSVAGFGVWHEALAVLREAPPEVRHLLAHACSARYETTEETSPERYALLVVLAVISPGLPEEIRLEERQRELAAVGDQFWALGSVGLLAEAELAAGRALPAATAAAFRRAEWAPAAKLAGPVLNAGERWADRAISELPELGEPWERLLAHALTARAAKPGAKWEKTGRALLAEIGTDAARGTMLGWLALVGRPRTISLDASRLFIPYDVNDAYDPYNANALRGLAWLLAFLPPHPDTSRALGVLADASLRKVPGLGPRNPKVANACVVALARIDSEDALAQLARLAGRVTFRGTRKIIDAALEERAVAMGLSRAEIEEMAVPGFGLTEVGRSVTEVGGCTAELLVRGGRAVLRWRTAAGREVKSVPAAVRRDHPEEVKELKAAAKDIDKMLAAQVERLDKQFLARRTWSYAAWRERFLDHPLVGTLARRLLWTVDGVPCGFADGALRTPADVPITEGGTVALWHPIGRESAEIVAWRDWLERHGITQPFKQAHREVYVLTDAERRTGTYSNRFAAHVLRQHQFHSLAAARGWRDELRLCHDTGVGAPMRELPQWGLRAEFWVEGCGEDFEGNTTDSGAWLRITTDQVRFYPIDAPRNFTQGWGGPYVMPLDPGENPVDPVPLEEIPDVVLSEVLRDADLFVGWPASATIPRGRTAAPAAVSRSTGRLTASVSWARAPPRAVTSSPGFCRG